MDILSMKANQPWSESQLVTESHISARGQNTLKDFFRSDSNSSFYLFDDDDEEEEDWGKPEDVDCEGRLTCILFTWFQFFIRRSHHVSLAVSDIIPLSTSLVINNKHYYHIIIFLEPLA